MSPSTSPLPALTVLTVAQWKSQLIDEALLINAYGIIMGTEAAPTNNADARLKTDYQLHQSSIIGLMRKSLDLAQKQTILGDLTDVMDAKGVYDRLLAAYEPKTSASRVAVIQELIAVRNTCT